MGVSSTGIALYVTADFLPALPALKHRIGSKGPAG
jgi:hypothetical protein